MKSLVNWNIPKTNRYNKPFIKIDGSNCTHHFPLTRPLSIHIHQSYQIHQDFSQNLQLYKFTKTIKSSMSSKSSIWLVKSICQSLIFQVKGVVKVFKVVSNNNHFKNLSRSVKLPDPKLKNENIRGVIWYFSKNQNPNYKIQNHVQCNLFLNSFSEKADFCQIFHNKFYFHGRVMWYAKCKNSSFQKCKLTLTQKIST